MNRPFILFTHRLIYEVISTQAIDRKSLDAPGTMLSGSFNDECIQTQKVSGYMKKKAIEKHVPQWMVVVI